MGLCNLLEPNAADNDRRGSDPNEREEPIRPATLTTIIALALLAPAGAAAKTDLVKRQHCQLQTLHADRGTLVFFRHHLPQARTVIGRHAVRFARARIRWTLRELAETRAALRPKPVLGHMGGWLCIHSREGAWNAQTGNGFYGGLQMTYGWAGRVTNAAMLSPGQQIAAAEAEAAEHRWAYSWMRGQWPNTFPPCAGYFE